VNEISPGPVHTPGARSLRSEAEYVEFEQRWASMGEWLKEPGDVARLALFLAGLPTHGPSGQQYSLAGRPG
jgi:NAD(P)-dependent dehydrogenase (short-subunit alcohol dehydrogenase family)